LQATLLSMEVIEVEESTETTIVVTAQEEWNYQDVSAETGQPTGEVRSETMNLRYTLSIQDGVWVVSRSSILDGADMDGR